MPFTHSRTIRFADTDAAGVAYFARYLSICHEAYEESLISAGIELKSFFDGAGVIVPISRSEADYLRPLACGERIRISVAPTSLSEDSYEIRYEIAKEGPPLKAAARLRTVHVCLDSKTRRRVPLPPRLAEWVKRSQP